jgi:hypothetical protein
MTELGVVAVLVSIATFILAGALVVVAVAYKFWTDDEL